MSSILKALKKLEKESPRQEEAVSWPQKIDTKKAISKRTKGTWIYRKFISVFFVVVLLAAGVWLFLSQKPVWIKKYFVGAGFFDRNSGESKTASIRIRKDVKKGPVPVSKREIFQKKMTGPSIVKASRPDSQKRNTGTVKDSKKPDQVKKVDRKKPAPVRKTHENTLKMGLNEKAGNDERDAIPETKTSRTGMDQKKPATLMKAERPGPGETAEEKKFVSAKIMDDSRLELQAIAWSLDVKKRIAVINGRVVREGATIEEFTISRIGKDEVFIMVGNEFRKLVFTTK